VVSFTPQPLYPQGKRPQYPLDRRLGGLQSRSGCGGEEKNSQPPPGIEPKHFSNSLLQFYVRSAPNNRVPHSIQTSSILIDFSPRVNGINNYTSSYHHHHHRHLSRIGPLGLLRFRIYFLKLMNPFGHLVGLLEWEIGPTQGLYLHRTTQHRKTRTHIHASSGIRKQDPSDRAATDYNTHYLFHMLHSYWRRIDLSVRRIKMKIGFRLSCCRTETSEWNQGRYGTFLCPIFHFKLKIVENYG
jgi:hypothetical protein